MDFYGGFMKEIFKNNELDYLDFIYGNIKDKVFAERVKYYLKWYIIKARKCRFYYYVLSVLSIILPLILSLLNLYEQNKCFKQYEFLINVIPLITSFISSILILGRFLDKWSKYRETISQINLFLNKYMDLQPNLESTKEKIALHREFDSIIEKEMNTWKKRQENMNNNNG